MCVNLYACAAPPTACVIMIDDDAHLALFHAQLNHRSRPAINDIIIVIAHSSAAAATHTCAPIQAQLHVFGIPHEYVQQQQALQHNSCDGKMMNCAVCAQLWCVKSFTNNNNNVGSKRQQQLRCCNYSGGYIQLLPLYAVVDIADMLLLLLLLWRFVIYFITFFVGLVVLTADSNCWRNPSAWQHFRLAHTFNPHAHAHIHAYRVFGKSVCVRGSECVYVRYSFICQLCLSLHLFRLTVYYLLLVR